MRKAIAKNVRFLALAACATALFIGAVACGGEDTGTTTTTPLADYSEPAYVPQQPAPPLAAPTAAPSQSSSSYTPSTVIAEAPAKSESYSSDAAM